MTPARSGYSALQISLHWLTLILVLGAWVTRGGAGQALRAKAEGLATGFAGGLPLHAMFGIAVLILTLVRLAVRLRRGAPRPPAGENALLRAAGIWGHRLIYALLILVPLGGLMTWITVQPTPHGLLGTLFLIVIAGHAAMAVIHQFLLRDGLLLRMLRPDRD